MGFNHCQILNAHPTLGMQLWEHGLLRHTFLRSGILCQPLTCGWQATLPSSWTEKSPLFLEQAKIRRKLQ